MRRILASVFFLMLVSAPFGSGSPITGSFSEKPSVGAEPWSITKTFKGGERACVLAAGRAREVVPIQLLVYDAKGNLIAEDQGPGDFVAVVWYPPRTAEYKVELRSPSKTEAKCYIAFK